MEFHIAVAGGLTALAAITEQVHALDPAAELDYLGETMRVATCLSASQIASAVSMAGHPVNIEAIVQQPSMCCGGCGG